MKIINDNRKALIITFWSAAFYLGIPSLLGLSQEQEFIYFLTSVILLVTVAVFGFVSLILIFIAHRQRRRQSKIAVIGAGLLVSLIFLIPLTLVINNLIRGPLPAGSNARTFNSTAWKAESSVAPHDGISVREQMLKDVVENMLPMKNKREIEKLLGPSLKTAYFAEIDKDMIYYLGPERNFISIDSEWLLIWLDEHGKFKTYEIVND